MIRTQLGWRARRRVGTEARRHTDTLARAEAHTPRARQTMMGCGEPVSSDGRSTDGRRWRRAQRANVYDVLPCMHAVCELYLIWVHLRARARGLPSGHPVACSAYAAPLWGP